MDKRNIQRKKNGSNIKYESYKYEQTYYLLILDFKIFCCINLMNESLIFTFINGLVLHFIIKQIVSY